jgi:SET domain-containing protein
VATRDIQAGEEITLDYGRGYWKTVAKWNSSLPVKSDAVRNRAKRAANRSI